MRSRRVPNSLTALTSRKPNSMPSDREQTKGEQGGAQQPLARCVVEDLAKIPILSLLPKLALG